MGNVIYSQDVMEPTAPTAFITKCKNRLKYYGKNVYLHDNDEFEIELYNPLSIEILAKVKISDIPAEKVVVLQPEEIVYLNNYVFKIDDAYENDPVSKRSHTHKGNIKIEFYEKEKQVSYFDSYIIYRTNKKFSVSSTSAADSNAYIYYTNPVSSIDSSSVASNKESNSLKFNKYYSWKISWKILPLS